MAMMVWSGLEENQNARRFHGGPGNTAVDHGVPKSWSSGVVWEALTGPVQFWSIRVDGSDGLE